MVTCAPAEEVHVAEFGEPVQSPSGRLLYRAMIMRTI